MIKNNQHGQSTIEFIFTFSFGVSVVFLIFNSALNYTTGYLTHYATFMASRVFLTAELYAGQYETDISGSVSPGADDAKEIFESYRLDVFKIDSSDFKVNLPSLQPQEALTVGARTLFELNIDAVGQVTGQKKLEMVSESFLGKEPVRAECARRTCFAITGTTSCSTKKDITLFDNGC